ncbi:hypothetical protein HT031_004082 [Scenedesmus sp. PABB004]|nr:hypothetical protein HT031_004082 [Scenedesmus sp. PABB004]
MEVKAGPTARPRSPATPERRSAARPRSASPRKRPAWVVANWKHRVPERPASPGPGGAGAGAGDSGERAAVAAAAARERRAAAGAAAPPGRRRGRARRLQRRRRAPRRGARPTFLTARSALLFEPGPGGGGGELAAQPWAGAVDLNPGMSLPAGSPARAAATCRAAPSELPALLARMHGVADELRGVGGAGASGEPGGSLSGLSHREALQASTQAARGALHSALRRGALAAPREQGPGALLASWEWYD